MNENEKRLRGHLADRQIAYQQLFQGSNAEAVLDDLAIFCRAHESTFDPDPRLAALLDGRREVWLRIINHLHFTREEMFNLSTGRASGTLRAPANIVEIEADE